MTKSQGDWDKREQRVTGDGVDDEQKWLLFFCGRKKFLDNFPHSGRPWKDIAQFKQKHGAGHPSGISVLRLVHAI
jgi:hypothetical protein